MLACMHTYSRCLVCVYNQVSICPLNYKSHHMHKPSPHAGHGLALAGPEYSCPQVLGGKVEGSQQLAPQQCKGWVPAGHEEQGLADLLCELHLPAADVL